MEKRNQEILRLKIWEICLNYLFEIGFQDRKNVREERNFFRTSGPINRKIVEHWRFGLKYVRETGAMWDTFGFPLPNLFKDKVKDRDKVS